MYDSPSVTPIFAAWDATANATHTQKSCQVQIEDLQAAITENIHQCTDSRGNIIYTFLPDSLGDYIDLVSAGNAFVFPAGTTGTLVTKVKAASLPTRKKCTIKSAQKVLQQIQNLSSTEKEVITKQRVGQGLFKDLLINKYHGKCALCGIQTEQMLIGSHIKSWKDSSDAEKLDENNGLLLCAHHDALFDKHLISFKDNGDLIVSTTLNASERAELQIAAIPPITVKIKVTEVSIMKQLPQKRELMDAILIVMKNANGAMNTATINDLVAKQLNIPKDLLEIEDANCSGTEYSYRMRWARTELKQKDFIRNVKRGEWEICPEQ